MFSVKRSQKQLLLAPLLALTLGIASCGSGETGDDTAATDGGDDPAVTENVSLSGAGASFPAPLYQRWFSEYNKENSNIQVSYQSVGSGAGVEQFTQGTVDFGASDVAMSDEEIAQVEKGVLLLPMTAGSIVMAYKLEGVEQLNLPRKVYVDILLGNITNWNDPAIKAANPDAELPDQEITVVYRSDGSGTTGVFTKHLSDISPEWEEKVGSGKTVEWPTGVGAKGNEGVTAQILQTEGAVGYVEYGYAKQQEGLTAAKLENASGKFIEPSPESAAETLSAVELPENFRAFITDPEGENSYPIVTYTWILAYKNYDDPTKAQALKDVLNYGLNEGQAFAEELGYVPLPDNVVEKVQEAIAQINAS
ncbi:MAG: phosphate ABC transporter substrate-binding protein PstS [Oscillatoria sp. PMC 1068.18]|nr:phosphate ABC transporter substrate-binding protein PstS [Oscillatoria sp. PMC 1076.18]MEC4989340.1 phosphate ABC transporter substrate-binding protein PstS [Oscillatoria sp. PMC 1068.18]